MGFTLSVLFFTPLLSGLLIFLVPKNRNTNYRILLVFAGAYLFAITVIHILPELYSEAAGAELIGLFVLAGFFLQQLLEYFTAGIEHGHLHSSDHAHMHSHHHHTVSAIVLLFALCVHAFLEGGMLAEPVLSRGLYNRDPILLGIVLHRAPAAFALMTVLTVQLRSRSRAIPYLVVFAFAAPAGLLIASYLANESVLSATGMVYLYAIVSGNFLHISTTIVFESSPGHKYDARKVAVALFGALVAVAVEYII